MPKTLPLPVVLLIFSVAFSAPSPGWQNAAPNATAPAIITEFIPEALLQQSYSFRPQASGGVPPLHWTVTAGELPLGLELADNGLISGVPKKVGEYRFTLTVTDSDQPAHHASKEFKTSVVAPLVLEWSRPPSVQGDRVDGAVKVTNGTKEDFDLTVIVVAVNEIGKAFALGYQHLNFHAGTADFEIPFGSVLPQGAYLVHADAVAEVPARNAIYRRRLQTPSPLQITAGP
jgi:hypothetical protein